jgi:hypothetical protein
MRESQLSSSPCGILDVISLHFCIQTVTTPVGLREYTYKIKTQVPV